MKEKDLVGKHMVSINDGTRAGTVKDLVFDELQLTALVVKGDRGEGLLPYLSLGSNGPDAITISSLSAVDWNPGKAIELKPRNLHHLRKLSVVDSEGNALGHIHDFTMDAAGHIQEFDVRTEGVFGVGALKTLVEASQVVAMGADLMTVMVASPK